ncbi:MAG: DUF86 domain-containing protein [Arcobacteraceae bacterium]|nr:DUF86 domain-containing protein [Arcobacteraceae bacterium]
MSSGLNRLNKIISCIEDIEFILNDKELKITQAIEDKIIKPAIRMNIVRIAEQFSKLKDDNEFKILEQFVSDDLKGISSVRNYIAHDYDSTDDNIIEDVVRYNLPIFKDIIQNIISKQNK